MKIIKPIFYDKFKCIADKCTDTCCAGWEIDIDTQSLVNYELLQGDFALYLRDNITTMEESSCFTLKENDRCPFLDENNLCQMILENGEELLCEICSEHPRFYDWYGDYEAQGLGLCCEVSCKLLLEEKVPLTFICEENPCPTTRDIDSAEDQLT